MRVADMAKADIVLKILLSLNQGKCGYTEERVDDALNQYRQLVKRGIIQEKQEVKKE